MKKPKNSAPEHGYCDRGESDEEDQPQQCYRWPAHVGPHNYDEPGPGLHAMAPGEEPADMVARYKASHDKVGKKAK